MCAIKIYFILIIQEFCNNTTVILFLTPITSFYFRKLFLFFKFNTFNNSSMCFFFFDKTKSLKLINYINKKLEVETYKICLVYM